MEGKMETVLILLLVTLIASITGYVGFYFGKKERKAKPLTPDEEERLRREKRDRDFQELFNYNERIATKGYPRVGDE
jgi:hypothetical protein